MGMVRPVAAKQMRTGIINSGGHKPPYKSCTGETPVPPMLKYFSRQVKLSMGFSAHCSLLTAYFIRTARERPSCSGECRGRNPRRCTLFQSREAKISWLKTAASAKPTLSVTSRPPILRRRRQ